MESPEDLGVFCFTRPSSTLSLKGEGTDVVIKNDLLR